MSDRASIDQLKKQLREALDANRSWKEQYERYCRDAEKVVGQLKEERRKNRDEIERRDATLAEKNQEIRRLDSELDAVKGKLNYLNRKYDETVEERDKLEKEIRHLKAKIDELKSSRLSFEEVEIYKHQSAVYQEDFQRERAEKKELQMKNRQLHSQVQKLTQDKLSLQDHADALRRQLTMYDPYYKKAGRKN